MTTETPDRGRAATLLALEPGRALLFLAGGIALWWLLTPVLDRLAVGLASVVLRVVDTGQGTFFHEADGGDWIAYSRRLSPRRTEFPELPVREVHAPLVLLPILIGWLPRRLGWSAPPKARFVLPLSLLVACQAIALAAWAQQIVATSYGADGARLFSDVERVGWTGATIAWRVGGRFVVVIAAWLLAYRAELIPSERG